MSGGRTPHPPSDQASSSTGPTPNEVIVPVISDVGQDRVLENIFKQMPCMQITRDRIMEPMTLADVKLLVVEFEVEALIARGDEVPNAAVVSSRYRCQWQQQTH